MSMKKSKTKSISRFARNTVDTLSYVRKLKEKMLQYYLKKKTSIHLIAKFRQIFIVLRYIPQK